MTIFRKRPSRKAPTDEAPTPKRRKLVAKRRKAPRGAIRLDANAPILEQLRSCL
jgi:hypothetical protein